MAKWLLIERLENWEVDRDEGFRRFGVPQAKKKQASQIRRGDELIFYVSSGISSFSDMREATADGLSKLGAAGDYDVAFALCISTKPKLTLERSQWVSIRDLVPQLSITSGKRDWRQAMRTSVRRLNEEDAATIIAAMQRAAKRS